MTTEAVPALDYIAEDLRPLARDHDSFTPYPKNPRRGNLRVVAESLATFGQQSPIVVQKSTGYIVAGNHVWEAAGLLAQRKIAVSLDEQGNPRPYADAAWTAIAANVEDIDDAEARAYLLADNRLSDLSSYDSGALIEVLQEADRKSILSSTGFGHGDLVALLAPKDEDVLAEDPPDDGVRESASSWTGQAMRQVVLLVPISDHAEFMRNVGDLRLRYRTESTVATVLRAVESQSKVHRG